MLSVGSFFRHKDREDRGVMGVVKKKHEVTGLKPWGYKTQLSPLTIAIRALPNIMTCLPD